MTARLPRVVLEYACGCRWESDRNLWHKTAHPRLLDLFCGAGGAAKGYHDAGFEVVGVDHVRQPRYPFEFHLGDAMTYPLEGFDAIHASPPCQGYSIMRNLPWLKDKVYPLLIEPTRERLQAAGVPYVIENVAGARRTEHRPDGMQAGWLCGGMFGLPFYRHRYFETNWFWLQPGHPKHESTICLGRNLGARARLVTYGPPGRISDGTIGHRTRAVHEATARTMGLDWMRPKELSQAIPPAYTEYIGTALMRVLQSAHIPAGARVKHILADCARCRTAKGADVHKRLPDKPYDMRA